MFDILLRYFHGFAKIKIRGIHINRFINLCKARDIKLWDLEQKEDELFFFVAANDITRLKEPAAKTGSEMEVLKECGLKQFVRKNKKRIPFVIGVFLFAVLIYIQSLFIWNISVTGESDYTKDEILSHVNKLYVKTGTLKSKVDCEELEEQLRKDFEDIAWISCSLEGTKLSIEITETLNVFTDTSMKEPCNIIASKDCTISDIVTASGTPVVTAGTDVKKGDVLISGAVYLYDDNNEVLDTNYVSAEGEVYGICIYHYKNEISLSYYTKEYTGKSKKYYSVGAFQYMFTPFVPDCPYENYDMLTDTANLHIGNSFFLPFLMEKTTLKEYQLKLETLSAEDACTKAQEKLNAYISNLQEKGVQIIENNVKIACDGDTCLAEGDIKVCQLIGIPKELEVISEEQTLE